MVNGVTYLDSPFPISINAQTSINRSYLPLQCVTTTRVMAASVKGWTESQDTAVYVLTARRATRVNISSVVKEQTVL